MVVIRGLLRERMFYKGTNKDYLPETKPSKGKIHCPRAQRVQTRHLLARINCRALNKPPYNFLYIIRRTINRFLFDAKILFIYPACYKESKNIIM